MLGLGIAMLLVLPTTWGNMIIVYKAGEMSRLWWVPTVCIINFLSAIMALYKAIGMLVKKKDDAQQDWDED